jgi:hypothetical protein
MMCVQLLHCHYAHHCHKPNRVIPTKNINYKFLLKCSTTDTRCAP